MTLADILTDITSHITTNGTMAITGNVLASVLTDMANNLVPANSNYGQFVNGVSSVTEEVLVGVEFSDGIYSKIGIDGSGQPNIRWSNVSTSAASWFQANNLFATMSNTDDVGNYIGLAIGNGEAYIEMDVAGYSRFRVGDAFNYGLSVDNHQNVLLGKDDGSQGYLYLADNAVLMAPAGKYVDVRISGSRRFSADVDGAVMGIDNFPQVSTDTAKAGATHTASSGYQYFNGVFGNEGESEAFMQVLPGSGMFDTTVSKVSVRNYEITMMHGDPEDTTRQTSMNFGNNINFQLNATSGYAFNIYGSTGAAVFYFDATGSLYTQDASGNSHLQINNNAGIIIGSNVLYKTVGFFGFTGATKQDVSMCPFTPPSASLPDSVHDLYYKLASLQQALNNYGLINLV